MNSKSRVMRRKLPTKPNQPVVTKINLLVFDDVEHELKEQGDEMEATNRTKLNQRVVTEINLLVLDDVEHELVVE